jgi:hypothetical protein
MSEFSVPFASGPNLEPPHPSFVHIAVSDRGLRVVAPDLNAEESYRQQTASQMKYILGLPNHTEGLDISRINEYAELMGASARPTKYLKSDDFLRAIADVELPKAHPEGVYVDAVGVVLVKRNVLLESLNGPAITESFAVHEKAHGTKFVTPVKATHTSRGRLLWKKHSVTMRGTRNGYAVRPLNDDRKVVGLFLEEGYAEFERGCFVERHDLVDEFTADADNYDFVQRSGLPMKYFYKDHLAEGKPMLTLTPGAFIAAILDRLVERDPELVHTMRESRKNAEGLRSFILQLNSLVPKLYPRLMHADEQSALALVRELSTD